MVFIDIAIGILSAIAILYWFRNLKTDSHKRFFARTLIIVALVYVGFAAIGVFTQTANINWLLLEIVGVFIYSLFACFGIKKSFWFLAIGWIAHVIWDVALHYGSNVAFVPDFYPNACIGFDIVFGVYIAYKIYFRD